MSSPAILSPDAPAVVLGGGINGLGQVRALGAGGVEAYCVAARTPDRFAALSRHAKWVPSPDPIHDPEAAVDAVLQLARRLKQRPMLLFAADAWLRVAAEHEEALRERFVLPQSPWPVLGRILDKHTLHELAQGCGVPEPATWSYDSIEEMARDIASLPYPCIVKLDFDSLDVLPDALKGTLRHRVTRYETMQQLRAWTDRALACGFTSPALVQEFIPGGAETLYTLTSYTNRCGTLLAGAVGHKIRQTPPDAGGITVGRIVHVDEVFEHGSRFLKAIGFHGLANTEFKYDARDGSYRLMEINPRLGVWNASTLFAGINLPMVAYTDMQGREYTGPRFTKQVDGTLWVNTLVDFMNCIRDYRVSGFPEHHLGVQRWRASIRGPKFDAVWQWDDPAPGLLFAAEFTKTRITNLLRNRGKRAR